MQALPSHVDTRSETYRTNREGFLEQISYLGEYLRAKRVPISCSLLESG